MTKKTLSGHKKSVGVLAPKKTSSLSKALGNLSASVIKAVTPKTKTTPFYPTPTGKPISKGASGFNPILGGGNISNAQAGVGATGTPVQGGSKSVVVLAPKGSTFRSSGGSSSSLSNISEDGTSLVNTRTFSPSSFSSPSGLIGMGTNASSVPTSSVVNTNTLGTQNQKITFSEAKVQDYSSLIPTAIEPQAAEKEDGTQTALQDYLNSLNEIDAPSSADAYNKAQKELGIKQKQELVNTLTGQLNGIVAKGQANQLSLVGQGRGIPTAILGGQSAEIARQTAIESLPISAQLSAAQGSLEMAEENLDTLYKIYSQDAQNKFEAKKEVLKLVYDVASAAEKRELEKLDKLETRDYNERQVVLKDIKDIATQAMQQQAPSSVLSNIFKATTYQEAVQAAGKYGGDYLARELLLQQIENVKSQISERNNTVNSYGTITGKPQTAAQSSANGYADRLAQADVVISTLGNKFTGKLAIGGSIPNFLQTDDRQMYEQAKRNFVNAVLRRESGAAIAESEFVSAEKQYFPQAGDNPGVVLQKEKSRNTAINNIYRESAVNRPVLPGQIIESNGVRYRVGMDGETLDIIQ